MKVKLLRKIRKKYSYIWKDEIMSDYTTVVDGVENRRVESRLCLVIVNERTKKAAHFFTESTIRKNIEEFLKAILDNDYWYYKKEKENRQSQRNYQLFKKRQQQIFPGVVFHEELINPLKLIS